MAGVKIVIAAIGLVQLAGGITALAFATMAIYEQQDLAKAVFGSVCAALFGSIGCGLLVALYVDRHRSRATKTVDAPANAPWLKRADWASKRILANGGATIHAPVLASIAIWWNVASVPLLTVLPTLLPQPNNHWLWATLLVPVAGVLLVAAFVHQSLRARRFGDSVFELASLPGVVGGQLTGIVRIPRPVLAVDGFRLRLICMESRSRRRDEFVDEVIWQDERLVMNPIVDHNETLVPVLFAIPYELPETSRSDAARDFAWRLDVWARVRGVDYAAKFDAPIYKTTESRADFHLDVGLEAGSTPPVDKGIVLREAGIIRELLEGGGVRLTFKAARNWPSALIISLFVFACGGLLIFTTLPLVPKLVVAALAALFGWVALDLWLYRSVIEASPRGLAIRGGLLGIGPLRVVATEDIQRFNVEEAISNSEGGVWKSVVVVPRRNRGKKLTLGKAISSKLAQEAVIDELNVALGRS